MKRFLFTIAIALVTPALMAAPAGPSDKVKYTKAKKQENFDAQVVEGQVYRPDLSVVTGDTELGGFGTLKLRNDFVDRLTAETNKEEAP